jgi:hypothetical protein
MTLKEKNERLYNNLTMLKALEEVDIDKAIEALSNPNLDPSELTEIIEGSMMGKIVFKESQEPLKLDNRIIMAGIRNRFNQISGKNI